MNHLADKLVNHQKKCRFCLKLPASKTVKISKRIEKNFLELTRIEVKFEVYFLFMNIFPDENNFSQLIVNDFYSSVICMSCNLKLSELADFQRELIENQVKLYQHESKQENEVKDSQTDDAMQEEFHIEALDESFLKQHEIMERKARKSAMMETEIWQCSDCNEIFRSKTLLKSHAKSEHKTSDATLKMCK